MSAEKDQPLYEIKRKIYFQFASGMTLILLQFIKECIWQQSSCMLHIVFLTQYEGSSYTSVAESVVQTIQFASWSTVRLFLVILWNSNFSVSLFFSFWSGIVLHFYECNILNVMASKGISNSNRYFAIFFPLCFLSAFLTCNIPAILFLQQVISAHI